MSQPDPRAGGGRARAHDRPERRGASASPAIAASPASPALPAMPLDPPAPGTPGPLLDGAAMQALFDEREAAIEAQHKIQRFFLAFDRRTDPRTADPALRAPMLGLMRAYDERQCVRVYYASRGQGIDLTPPAPAVLDVARTISRIFRECAPELDGHRWTLAPLAFELFAAGRLAITHPDPTLQASLCMHGAPDGWNFFQFAEHAFTCVAAGIDADVWDPLLEPLVASADLLAHRGRGALEPRMPSERRSARYAHWDGRCVPMTEVHAVRARYRKRLAGLPDDERRRRLADLFAHALAVAGFGRFTTIFTPPGKLRALLEPGPLGAPDA